MITKCRSYGDHCPCLDCNKECCIEMGDKIDTEKLCKVAREHCERCALEYEKRTRGNEDAE